MATYRQTRELAPTEAVYLGGLIDGEGTISLFRKHRLDNRQLVISISSTEASLLTYAKEIVGAGKITSKRTYQPHHTPSGAYVVTNRQALELLRQVAPHLRSYKAQRAAEILKDYVRLTPRNGQYTPQLLAERQAFIQRVLNLHPNAKPKIQRSL